LVSTLSESAIENVAPAPPVIEIVTLFPALVSDKLCVAVFTPAVKSP